MFRKSWIVAVAGMILAAGLGVAGTFGRVVTIGGQANDLALDEARGVLYVANFTANRIEVMSLATNTIQTSINVAQQPNGISLSPDGHWLVVSHYGNKAAPASQTNALTLIDLTAANARQTFALGNPPLGVAFGIDNKALVVTTSEFLLFDPALGTTEVIQTVPEVATKAIPQPPASFPPTFAQASVAASRDGLIIAGFSDSLAFRYRVATHGISATTYSAAPVLGPRVVSLSNDGSLMSLGWWLLDSNFLITSVFGKPAGLLNVGSTLLDSSRGLVYAQVPPTGTTQTANTSQPILQILDSDNLTLREQLQLPENLAGKSTLSSDNNTMYAISDSGVLVLPVGKIGSSPRLAASTEDIVFRGNFCNRNVSRQLITITDPGGGNTLFNIASSTPGLTVSPSSGTTPMTVTVSVDPNAFSSQKGSVLATLAISSSVAVNSPPPIRVIINSQDPAQRGTFINVPGKIVDLLADPKRSVYYLLRQDKNQVLVYNSANHTLKTTLRTCTTPTSMAITFDQQTLLVGCDSSQYIGVFDLDQLISLTPISTQSDNVQSLAVSSNAILAMMRSNDGSEPHISSVDLLQRVTTRLPTLGVWENKLALDTALAGSSNGAHILVAGSDGSVMIYDANVNSFTVSRKDFTSMGGSYAASSFDRYVVGNRLLDSSGVAVGTLSTTSGSPSGFAFVDQSGYFTTAASSSSPGVIARVDLITGRIIQPTQMVEAPLLGTSTAGPAAGTNCSSSTTTTANVTTITTSCITGSTVSTTTQTCTTSTVKGTTTTNCTSSSDTGTIATQPSHNWTRSLAPLPDQSAIINLTTSGFTVLPWTYAAAVAPPQVNRIVSAADGKSAAAPGGLISLFGNQLAPTNLATKEIPVPTALANSCVTVNGQPMPIIFVSPTQINAQMPFQALGNVTIIVHTPGGVSDNFNLTVLPTAPAIFLSGVAGPDTNLPTVVRSTNNLLVTDSNPIHRNDQLTIYLTGLGQTTPVVDAGLPAPGDPLALALTPPAIQLGGQDVQVDYAGLAPGEVGVYQINLTIPRNVPTGLGMPLTIHQGGSVFTVNLRVVD